MKHVAVILAGGSGNRFGAERPKQLLPLGGKSVLAWSLDAFERNAGIDEICIVAHPDTMETVRTIVSKGGWKKISRILPGGKERSDSSLAAIRAYSGTDACLLLHDAARPLISQRIIDDVLSALQTAQAVTTALPSADTIARVDGCGNVDNIPDRAQLRRIQTPQAFRLGTLEEAYSRASADPDFRATDDCGVVLRYMPDVPVATVLGEESNMKLTYAGDLHLLETFIPQDRSPQPAGGDDPLQAYLVRQLRPLQLRMLDMLTTIGDILDRNGIRWWMQGGTLLGAVRHGGFIPWDDDMDIDVYKPDVPRMVEALRRELPPNLILPDPPRSLPVWKVRCTDSFYAEPGDDFAALYNKGVFIDIFPQGDVPTLPRAFVRHVARQYSRANSILSRPHYYSLRAAAEWLWFGARRAVCRMLWEAGGLLSRMVAKQGVYVAQDLRNNGLGLLHRKERLFPLQRIPFEDRDFPAPADPGYYLRESFGDYTQLPPPGERHGHAVFYAPRLA